MDLATIADIGLAITVTLLFVAGVCWARRG
jgi:hypothetical protein